jgi:predicted RNA-binding Zn-ribbon protein involved in translation (DUF1610 family)
MDGGLMDYCLDAPCGLYCGACGTVLADRKGTVAELAEEWRMEAGHLVCHGCRSDTVAVFCRDCRFRACAASREIDHCSECGEFPCGDLVRFRNDEAPHHSVVLVNLRRIREVGVEAWLEEQRLRWSCPSCGEACYWYDERCRTCGAGLFDSRAEEAGLPPDGGDVS